MEHFSAAITFGRMNPPTKGHLKLMEKLHSMKTDKKLIYLSHTQDAKKNPLSYEDKYFYVKNIAENYFDDIEVVYTENRLLFKIIVDLWNQGCDELYVIVGGDRIGNILPIQACNGKAKEGMEPPFNFKKFEIVSAGDRNPDADDEISSMSATKARNFVKEGNFKEFCECIPIEDPFILKDMYEEIRNGLKLN